MEISPSSLLTYTGNAMKTYQPLHVTDIRDIKTVIKNSGLNFNHLVELDREAVQNNSLVGRYFHRPVADGRAFYQVTKVSRNKAYVQLCDGICLDNYCDSILGGGGWFSLSIIQDQIRRMDGLRELHSFKKKVETK
jgi:hypothetical protein